MRAARSLLLASAALLAACLPPRAGGAGEECVFNGDCASPLVCAGRRCRAPCRSDADCSGGLRCRPASASLSVCAPPEDAPLCGPAAPCALPLVCAIDGYCRAQCRLDYDCRFGRPGERCVAGSCVAVDAGSTDVNIVDTMDAGLDATEGGGAADAAEASAEPGSELASEPGLEGGAEAGAEGGFDAGPRDAWRFDVGADADPALRVAMVGSAGGHRCMLSAAGQVLCMGLNTRGERGTGALGGTPTPSEATAFPAGLRWVSAQAGTRTMGLDGSTCVLEQGGTVYCVGSGTLGQLGNGALADSLTPVRVLGLTDAVELALGNGHACARTSAGAVWCWGAAALGSNAMAPSATPTQVTGLTDAVELSLGADHACARRVDGTVVCWGSNTRGQLGTGDTTSSATPVAVSGLTGAVSVGVGWFTSCAALGDGSARCWGDNTWGQTGLGRSTTTPVLLPTAVAGLTSVQSVYGGPTSCAVRRGARDVLCWGRGQATGIPSAGTILDGGLNAPTLVSPLQSVRALSRGPTGDPTTPTAFLSESLCALRDDGALWCWGGNPSAQGFFSSYDVLLPVVVLR